MTRAVRVWAALERLERNGIEAVLSQQEYGGQLVAALNADLDEHDRLKAALHAPSYPALVPVSQAGPRREPVTGRCACGKEVGTELFPRVQPDGSLVWLGPVCWKNRSLGTPEWSGDQLEAFRIPPKES